MPKKPCKDVDSTDICKFLVKYCKEMEKWGKKVRRDIIDLERAVCELQQQAGVPDDFICDKTPGGDPGSPPDPPDWDD